MQNPRDHPVKRSLTPLHRRGIAASTGGELTGAEPPQPPRQASPATPPQEGNCRLQRRGIGWCRTTTTTPSGFACHPSKGGELPYADTRTPPRQAELDTPPEEGNCRLQRRGISWYKTHTTTPSGYACHPSRGGELACADTRQPPRQAELDTPPEEGN